MDVYEAIRTRRSIRRYKETPIPEDVLRRVLEAARQAPSARNRQEWRAVVVRDPEMRRKLSGAARNQAFVAQAPVVLVVCALQSDHIMTCGQPCHLIDVAIFIDHLTLAATAEGLGTCWIGAYFPDQVRPLLGIPADIQIIQLLTLGYPDEAPGPRDRKSFDEVYCFERWS